MANNFRVGNLLGKTGTFSSSLTISGNPVLTGENLFQNYSGSYVTTGQTGVFATSSNLASTGSNLQGQITSLSGTLTGNYVTIGTTQTITGNKTFNAGTLLAFDLKPTGGITNYIDVRNSRLINGGSTTALDWTVYQLNSAANGLSVDWGANSLNYFGKMVDWQNRYLTGGYWRVQNDLNTLSYLGNFVATLNNIATTSQTASNIQANFNDNSSVNVSGVNKYNLALTLLKNNNTYHSTYAVGNILTYVGVVSGSYGSLYDFYSKVETYPGAGITGLIQFLAGNGSRYPVGSIVNRYGFYAQDGAGSANCQNQYGLYIDDFNSTVSAYGINSNISASTNKWNIFATGSASNYFNGSVGINITPSEKLHVVGNIRVDNGSYFSGTTNIASVFVTVSGAQSIYGLKTFLSGADIYDTAGVKSIYASTRRLFDSGANNVSLDWQARNLYDASAATSVDWTNRILSGTWYSQNLNVGPGAVTASALLNVGPPSSTTAASGLTLGSDSTANLYRSAASTIKTDASFITAGSVGVAGSTTVNNVLTLNSTVSSGRAAVNIVNPNVDTTTASNGRTFFGWLPISVNGSGKWIPLYN